jgi:hypothetical protein
VFQRHGVEQYNPAGDKFDPNLHQAMFEVPDPTKEAGMVAVVTKVRVGRGAPWRCARAREQQQCRCWLGMSTPTPALPASFPPPARASCPRLLPAPPRPTSQRGYKMHDRVLRAAEVGVYKAP